MLSILPPAGWAVLDSRRGNYIASGIELSESGYHECGTVGSTTYRIWIPAAAECGRFSSRRNPQQNTVAIGKRQ